MDSTESALFLASMEDVVPLKGERRVPTSVDREEEVRRYQAAKRLQAIDLLNHDVSCITPVDSQAELSFRKPGIQGQVFKLFRQGKYPVDAQLSLKGVGLPLAKERLYDFIENAKGMGFRNVSVVHGTGINNKPFPALVKSSVAQWLKSLDGVLAYHSAPQFLGGVGVTLVMLVKSDEARLVSRETNHKGVKIR
ncbi:hypothetical protein BEL05_16150 [Shewanella colwelliana]|uniref:Smr domain-containing protein n=1 Tax=Shewanella colwelliana TaxID=23 RepID=A0A1E5INX5_SHECO|nr:Smr/MutS family protein [Shewanella colwelliana]OEG72242.1 hypothetical protein BEL05_04460 [Shewanella colwelliana]OEG75763.1 hypothetical protein BEL05_16150 [Shewanella colwelliana]